MYTRINPKDLTGITAYARTRVGIYAIRIIEEYAKAHKIGTSRAGRAFWALADDGVFEIAWEPLNGYARLDGVKETA